ncbi:MAG: glycerate 2-kinase, partial [bacterium]
MALVRVLVAPDSFKGTHSATAVADALARGFEHAGWEADRCPVADGGEGTMELLARAFDARLVPARATDPLGRAVDCSFALARDGGTAIVETAQASGLARVGDDERDAWAASTRGSGELILAAVAAGAREILVAVGGSATTDGGRGAIEAIRAGGGLGDATLAVLCDVDCAWEDAARVFGPQKGADGALVVRLEQRLAALASELPRDPRGVVRTGAAGGLSGGLWAAFDAELRAGACAVLDAVGVDERLRAAQLAVAGEGCIDSQSFGGKIVGELVRRA